MPELPHSLLGIPVYVSRSVDPGAVFAIGPATFPGGLPQLVRLKGVNWDELPEVREEPEATS